MLRCARRAVTLFTVIATTVAALPLSAFAQPGGGAMTRAEYEACQSRDEAQFKTAIATVTEKALLASLSSIDYPALVTDEWRAGDLDRIVDTRVDLAVAEVRDETSWGSLIKSLASKEKAQELATQVAERVYRSDAMKAAIEGLAGGVGREIGKRLELAGTDAAEPALTCLQAFLGPRYGTSVAKFVVAEGDTRIGVDGQEGTANVTSGDILKQSSGGIAGAAVLVLRRQMANMARRLGQRLVGSVLSRLVSVAAGGVGLVLIAKDIWDLRHGVLPIIADEMKSPATKEKVREELATVLGEEIREHVKEIAGKSADHVVDVWQNFRRAHAKVLELAEASEPFKRYLNSLSGSSLARLDEVVSLVLAAEGEAGVLKRLEDGTLDQAVNRLPPAGMEIAQASRSLETALKWQAIAGESLEAVVRHEIHLRAKPEEFSSATLKRVLGIGDRLATTRLAGLSRTARDTLFELDEQELRSLARSLAQPELETLAGYLAGLAAGPRERVLKAVAADPATMQLIAPERVRRAVVASRDQMAAVEMMLRPQGVLDPVAAYEDIVRAWNGRVSPVLLWEKHPAALVILAIVALFVLLLLRRLFRPRRPREDAGQGGTPGPTQATGQT